MARRPARSRNSSRGTRSRAAPPAPKTAATERLRALGRRLARLTAARETARERHARDLAALRRAADRQLASMMSEIAALRHHEARVEALTRLLAEREAALRAQANRIARLEALLRTPTELG